MRNLCLLFIILGVLLSGCSTVRWVQYSGADNVISFTMPIAPEEQKQSVDTVAGKINFVIYSSEFEGSAYYASYNIYPPQALQDREIDQILDGARDGAVSSIQGKLLSEKNVNQNSIRGREIRIETSDRENTLIVRIFYNDFKLYQIGMVVKKEKAFEKSIEDYLNSFVIH